MTSNKASLIKPKDIVYLHVGMHKTGTTSIQRSLQGYDNGEIRYANLGPSNHSVAIKTIFGQRTDQYGVHKVVGRSSSEVENLAIRNRDELVNELTTQSRKLIISGEDIGILTYEELDKFKQFLSAYTDSVKIVAYVREPYGYASSMFQQDVKTGLAELITRAPRYRMHFEKFLTLFGEPNCEFVNFDPQAFPEKCVVTDFCSRLGIEMDGVDPVRANDGLPSEAVALLFFWNRDGVDSTGMARLTQIRFRLIAILRSHYHRKFKLDPSLVDNVLDEDDIGWMQQILGIEIWLRPDTSKAGTGVDQVSSLEQLSKLRDSATTALIKLLESMEIPVLTGEPPVQLLNRLYLCLLADSPADESHAITLRDIAIKLENSDQFGVSVANELMEIANAIRPGKFILKKLEEYRRVLDTDPDVVPRSTKRPSISRWLKLDR